MARCLYVVLLLVSIIGAQGLQQIKPQPPLLEFKSEGGKIEAFGQNYEALRDAGFQAARIVLHPRGFMLPLYTNFHTFKIVVKGSGVMGMSLPHMGWAQPTAYRMEEGDLVAIPRGVTTWFLNDCHEDMEILAVDHAGELGFRADEFKKFHVGGGRSERKHGGVSYTSVLQGFSHEVLSHAWDVDEEVVERFLGARRNETGIIKLSKDVSLPESWWSAATEFIHRYRSTFPDVKVEKGGEVRKLDSRIKPVLHQMQLAATCVRLEKGAMVAPNYVHNADEVIYAVEGNARVQVVDDKGRRILDENLEAGSLVLIPKAFPSVKVAGERGFKYLAFFNSERPMFSFLAGEHSVFSGIPGRVLSAALSGMERVQEQRRGEDIIFPPQRTMRREATY